MRRNSPGLNHKAFLFIRIMNLINYVCDKCGKTVPSDNDALSYEAVLYQHPRMFNGDRTRHLVPVVDENGTVLCQGSPSRAQYFPGQAPDTHPEYKINPERLDAHRMAYTKFLEEANTLREVNY